MSTNQTDRDTWRKFLGIKDPSATLESRRVGGSIGRTAGRSGGGGGGGNLDSDSVPEGDVEDGAEKGDGAGDAGEQIKQGDEFDRLEDLYDCETGEEVKIDGLGQNGSEQYPTGFESCSKPKKPSMEDLADKLIYTHTLKRQSIDGVNDEQKTRTLSQSKLWENASVALSFVNSVPCPHPNFPNSTCRGVSESSSPNTATYTQSITTSGGIRQIAYAQASYTTCGTLACKQYYINEWVEEPWPGVDKNHLNWNKEKGCFEPLCPELNTAVSDKFKGCEKERILCDKDGNKVKVEVDGNTVKVTQAKYNQTAEIKNGKVQTVKKLTESQTEAEFK